MASILQTLTFTCLHLLLLPPCCLTYHLIQTSQFVLKSPRRCKQSGAPRWTCSGTGKTLHYNWRETDEAVQVEVPIQRNIPSKHVTATFHTKGIHVHTSSTQILQGKLKGEVAPSECYWWMEEVSNKHKLYIWLQKSKAALREWMGVLQGERVEGLHYDSLGGHGGIVSSTIRSNPLPEELLMKQPLKEAEAEDARQWLLQWSYSDKQPSSSSSVGIPSTQLRVTPYELPGGIRFVMDNPKEESWEAEDWVDVQIAEDDGCLCMIAKRGKIASGLLGRFGGLVTMQVKDTEDRLLRKLQQDLLSSPASLKELEGVRNRGSRLEMSDEEGSGDVYGAGNWSAPPFLQDAALEEVDPQIEINGNETEHQPPFMKEWSKERRNEYQRLLAADFMEKLKAAQQPRFTVRFEDIIKEAQKHLGINETETKRIWRVGGERSDKFGSEIHFNLLQNEQLKRKRITNMSELSPHNRGALDELKLLDVNIEEEMPSEIKDSTPTETEGGGTLLQLYESLNNSQKEDLKDLWKADFHKFVSLVSELSNRKDEEFPFFCDPHRELLLSNKYPILLKEYLLLYPPTTENAKRTIRLVNQFVISLYEDLEAVMNHNAKQQMKKISLLCQQALLDETKLTEYAESMKDLFDSDFLSFIVHSIQAETLKISKTRDPDVHPSDWLILLMIIKKGVMSLFEREISEDGMWLTMLVTQKQPEVRESLLKMMIANLPKADWKQFKSVAKSMTLPAKNNPSAYESLEYPWLTDALLQLDRDIDRVLPDWMIEGLLSDDDRQAIKKTQPMRSIFWRSEEIEKLVNISSTEESDRAAVMKFVSKNEHSKRSLINFYK